MSSDNSVLNRNLLIVHTKFPHIGKTIEIFWGHKEFPEYITNLLADKRAGRHGFPAEITDALILLQSLHDKIFPEFLPPQSFAWTFAKE